MKAPLRWLREYCAPDIELDALTHRLDLVGTKVERVEVHGVGDPAAFVVGRVLEAAQHPDADRLTVCTVDVGEPQSAQIVCGAPNVAAGQAVAVARPGAIMPGGARLKAAKLRGVRSEGMILAEDEVGIGVEHAGTMVLEGDPADLLPGTPLERVLPIRDTVLEFEITPNRPDCLSVYGIAREVHAATGAPLAPPPWAEDPGTLGADPPGITVRVEAPDLCPRFTARVFENVTLGPSPWWLKARLMAAGQRPINNVVDITNYVMLLVGQPLHAFDLDRVAGGLLVVRRARDGEQMVTLDEQTRTLDSEMLVIDDDADPPTPTSIAGVMGGMRSEVHEGTTRVLMEAATWIGPNIHRTSTKLGLRSEASARFEKQLAPEQALWAQAVAAQLMIELCGATLAPGTLDVAEPEVEPPPIRLREAKVERLLGMPIDRGVQMRTLDALGFDTIDAPDGLDVRVPGFRRMDVTREADLIEEVGRFELDKLPATLPSRRGASGRLTHAQAKRRRAEDALCGAGVSEVVGWSFAAPDLTDRLRLPRGDVRRRVVEIRNPMSVEHSVLRTMLLGSLLDALRHNAGHGSPHARLWERGAIYLAEPRHAEGGSKLPEEHEHLACVLTGPARPATWRESRPPEVDVFAAKGLLDAVLGALRVPYAIEPAEPDEHPFLHPARAANVVIPSPESDAPVSLGWLGELHPAVAADWELDGVGRIAAFELDLGRVEERSPHVELFTDLTTFPAVRQDLAVVVADDVPAARVVEVVREAGGALLYKADVFDVYTGAQVGEGRRSLALALEFRASDRTLTDEEVARRREKIVSALAGEVGGELRGG